MMIDGHRPHCQMSVGAELGSWEDGSSNTAGWQPEDDDLGEVLRWVHLVMTIVYVSDAIWYICPFCLLKIFFFLQGAEVIQKMTGSFHPPLFPVAASIVFELKIWRQNSIQICWESWWSHGSPLHKVQTSVKYATIHLCFCQMSCVKVWWLLYSICLCLTMYICVSNENPEAPRWRAVMWSTGKLTCVIL